MKSQGSLRDSIDGTSNGAAASTSLDLVQSNRVVDLVYERIRDAILSGELVPGERLSVPLLAEKLGVSRSPVREAVQRLTSERLAQEQPRKGAVVATIGLLELASLYEVREVLEGLAARLAAGRMTADRLAQLQRILDDHEAAIDANDRQATVDADVRFHTVLRLWTGNRLLLDQLDIIQGEVRLAMRTTSTTGGGPRNAVEDHRRIYDALRSGDSVAAEARARDHIRRLHDSLVTVATEADAQEAGA